VKKFPKHVNLTKGVANPLKLSQKKLKVVDLRVKGIINKSTVETEAQ
jgi:hypothetical protein